MVSPKLKFIMITVDELILVPIALFLVAYLLPEFLLPAILLGVGGSILFVAVKWYLVYPALQDGSYELYDLKGMTGKVIEDVTSKHGKVKVGQEIWDARCDEGEIPVGSEVKIISRESMRVKVLPLGDDQ